jgi:hypothetical protein
MRNAEEDRRRGDKIVLFLSNLPGVDVIVEDVFAVAAAGMEVGVRELEPLFCGTSIFTGRLRFLFCAAANLSFVATISARIRCKTASRSSTTGGRAFKEGERVGTITDIFLIMSRIERRRGRYKMSMTNESGSKCRFLFK